MSDAKIHAIIHGASAAAAAVGAVPLPVPDAGPIVGIQIVMIIAIAKHYGHDLDKAMALSFITETFATTTGVLLSKWLVKLIPGVGSAINASIGVSITESIGWYADKYFKEKKD